VRERQAPRSLAQRCDEIVAIIDAMVGAPTIDSSHAIEEHRPERADGAIHAAA
jgi:hypothetical protein